MAATEITNQLIAEVTAQRDIDKTFRGAGWRQLTVLEDVSVDDSSRAKWWRCSAAAAPERARCYASWPD